MKVDYATILLSDKILLAILHCSQTAPSQFSFFLHFSLAPAKEGADGCAEQEECLQAPRGSFSVCHWLHPQQSLPAQLQDCHWSPVSEVISTLSF